MWEIVNPYDTDQENGTELWNYCIVVGPGQTLYILSMDPHIGLDGNEIADSLAKPVTTDTLLGNTCLFAELSSIKRMELSALRTIPLCSPLVFWGKISLVSAAPRNQQTVLSHFIVATLNLLLYNRRATTCTHTPNGP
ncbi:hypothetical protein TNCV_2869241 [Trichonephila clavipes]|nr:hypothetical protein TNCV_2869241 [Trichonephila clavipes]